MKKFICFYGEELWSVSENYTPLTEDEFERFFNCRNFIPLPETNGEYFLVDLDECVGTLPIEGYLVDHRDLILGESYRPQIVQLTASARGYLEWLRTSKYCGKCGGRNEFDYDEKAAVCRGCGNMKYPRISPCVIVLVHDGNKILLANNVRYRSRNLYSLLAGYLEPGESLEDAIHREIFEETNIRVSCLEYRTSQCWPFPQQLMAGFYAKYESGIIRLQEDELSDAGWFDIDELPMIPHETTVAGKLIQMFVSECRSK